MAKTIKVSYIFEIINYLQKTPEKNPFKPIIYSDHVTRYTYRVFKKSSSIYKLLLHQKYISDNNETCTQ